jgi:hypothetical protein
VEAIRDPNSVFLDAAPIDRFSGSTLGFDLDGTFLQFENRAMTGGNNLGRSNV